VCWGLWRRGPQYPARSFPCAPALPRAFARFACRDGDAHEPRFLTPNGHPPEGPPPLWLFAQSYPAVSAPRSPFPCRLILPTGEGRRRLARRPKEREWWGDGGHPAPVAVMLVSCLLSCPKPLQNKPQTAPHDGNDGNDGKLDPRPRQRSTPPRPPFASIRDRKSEIPEGPKSALSVMLGVIPSVIPQTPSKQAQNRPA
jgi:hypothetical protein